MSDHTQAGSRDQSRTSKHSDSSSSSQASHDSQKCHASPKPPSQRRVGKNHPRKPRDVSSDSNSSRSSSCSSCDRPTLTPVFSIRNVKNLDRIINVHLDDIADTLTEMEDAQESIEEAKDALREIDLQFCLAREHACGARNPNGQRISNREAKNMLISADKTTRKRLDKLRDQRRDLWHDFDDAQRHLVCMLSERKRREDKARDRRLEQVRRQLEREKTGTVGRREVRDRCEVLERVERAERELDERFRRLEVEKSRLGLIRARIDGQEPQGGDAAVGERLADTGEGGMVGEAL